jgi:beta-galactosidase/beta-glucuronidase
VTPRPEYPRPALRRPDWVNLNGDWQFALGDDPGRFRDRIRVPFAPQAELSGLMDRRLHDVAWYRRSFDAPPAERLLLHFGAVDYRATVWVNGTQLMTHEGGHTPFTADITQAVKERGNELVVNAEDPARDLTIPRGKQYWKERGESIFYTPTTGIWQTVWLEPLPARHIEEVRLLPDLSTGSLGFEVAAPGPIELEVTLAGRRVAAWRGGSGAGSVGLDAAEPWSPERPVLYDVSIALQDGGDRVDSYFGLRSVGTENGRFLLNGEPYVQRLVLDQGYFPGGLLTAPSDDDLRRDIELAKAMGFNGARKHQKIEDPRWLYWADRLGFLVWAEMPAFHEHSAEAEDRLAAEWSEAVRRDRDRPSVVAWVPMNESFGIRNPPVDDATRTRFLLSLYHLTRELDATRPVVPNDGWDHARTDLLTLHDYGAAADLAARYRDLQTTLEPGGRPYPPYLPGFEYRGEPVIMSEFGGVAFGGQGWGYTAVGSTDEFVRNYAAQVEALMAPGPIEGFCYTQLTDVEQEQNGLLTFDRRPKVPLDRLRPLTLAPKRV